ncbi:hypothetical protein MUCCIDRAFT_107894 [Mucor lusitanicus CBS 277.49]|uniref:Peptidase S9 prolyl oligopeptidase catalytic domain-containing protein n=1 Tax=Mucor lusitanicus CBS 277.49 TaxID=747725 RepID=A0A168P7I3_MUCCL|nr:hypothetical protein MUCCIDRAFT_107894 [Mucor lusitanicus CBS 277.49]
MSTPHPFYDLETGLDYVLSKFDYLDGERVAGLGGSYGGFTANNWLNGRSNNEAVNIYSVPSFRI